MLFIFPLFTDQSLFLRQATLKTLCQCAFAQRRDVFARDNAMTDFCLSWNGIQLTRNHVFQRFHDLGGPRPRPCLMALSL